MGKLLSVKEKENLGQELTAIVEKYTGMKKGIIQQIVIGIEVDEPVTIKTKVVL